MRESLPLHRRDDRSSSRLTSRSVACLRVSMNRDRIKYYREYDHFASNCPSSVTDEESDQYDSGSHSVLQILAHDNLIRASSGEAIDHLNL